MFVVFIFAFIIIFLFASSFWDDTIESNTETSAKGFMTEIEQLGMTLVRASGDFAAVDTQQAEDFNNLLADVKGSWRVIENAYTK